MAATQVILESNAFFYGIEYLAVFCCGLLGGLAAVRKHYDLFAILLTAWVTSLGGGLVRDVILGARPPVGISDKGMVITALAAGLIVAVMHPEVDRMHWSMIVLDALALGLFAVNGTQKALMYGTSGMAAVFLGMAAVFLGMFTALAGGLIRDVLLNEVPTVVRDRHWYAFPSFIGSVLTVVSTRARANGLLNPQGEIVVDVAIVILVVVMRVLSVRFDITLPGAMPRREALHMPERSRTGRGTHVSSRSQQDEPVQGEPVQGVAAQGESAQGKPTHGESSQPLREAEFLRKAEPARESSSPHVVGERT